MPLDETPELDNPDWWLLRLGRRMRKRNGQLDQWWNYYRGKPPLPELPANAQQAFVDFQRKSRTNFCGLVAHSSVHRLLALGVTDAEGRPDANAARWWQQNRMDSRQKLVFRTAMSQSLGYVMVGPHPTRTEANGRPSPLMTPEHPRECITEDDPETGEPYVGLKAMHNDVDGYGYARVCFDDITFAYKTKARCLPHRLPWGPDSWEPLDDGEPHDLGMMPIVAFPCRPDLGEDPEAEFAGIMDIQDRINMGILNRMAASRYSGFRQKYVTGHKFAKKKDPDTGELILIEQPFVPSPSAVWASEGEQARFGQLDATDLTGFLREHESDVRDALILSATPAYYYANDLVNISADTVNALDILHLAKIREHIAAFGEALEDVHALCVAQAGVDVDPTQSTVRFADPRQLNPAIMADAATKLKAIGYPLDVLAEMLGETPERVQRITSGAAAAALLGASLLPTTPGAPAVAPPAPEGEDAEE